MSIVRVNTDLAAELVGEYRTAASTIDDVVADLDGLLGEASALLGGLGVANPLDELVPLADDLRTDGDDLEWRAEYLRRNDTLGDDLLGRSIGALPAGWDGETARAVFLVEDLDAHYAAGDLGGHPTAVASWRSELLEMIAELIGTDDPDAVRAVLDGLANGEPVLIAVANIAPRLQAKAHQQQVELVMAAHGLDEADAVTRLAELHEATAVLIADGWPAEEAAVVVDGAFANGLDLALIVEVADTEGIPLVDAANLVAQADVLAMTPDEWFAFQGMIEHFDEFDTARNGVYGRRPISGDDKFSEANLTLIVDNPDRYESEVVAAAAALLAQPALLNRIDSATNTDLFEGDAFGSSERGDGVYSRDDLEAFMAKQQVQYLLGDHATAIDTAALGGEADGYRSKNDFEAFLQQHRDSLSDIEIEAVEAVINGALYDQTWWEENKRSIALAAAVVAGATFVIVTGGVGSGVSGMLITTVAAGTAGAATAGAATVGLNAFSDQSDWNEDVGSNAFAGFFAGAGAGGAAQVFVNGVGTTTLAGKAATALGLTSDVSGLTAMGAFDLGLQYAPVVGGDNLAATKDIAETVSIVTGVTGAGVASTDWLVNGWYTPRLTDDYANQFADEVADVSTWSANGVTRADAEKFLETPDGSELLKALRASDPTASRREIEERALLIVESGADVPEAVVITEPLVKIAPSGAEVASYSPYWTTVDDLQNAIESGADVADYFGLPQLTTVDSYDVHLIAPNPGAVAFRSTIAPTEELFGLANKGGGGTQYVVPQRSQFGPSVRIEEPGLTTELSLPAAVPRTTTVAVTDDILPRGTVAVLADSIGREGE